MFYSVTRENEVKVGIISLQVVLQMLQAVMEGRAMELWRMAESPHKQLRGAGGGCFKLSA